LGLTEGKHGMNQLEEKGSPRGERGVADNRKRRKEQKTADGWGVPSIVRSRTKTTKRKRGKEERAKGRARGEKTVCRVGGKGG